MQDEKLIADVMKALMPRSTVFRTEPLSKEQMPSPTPSPLRSDLYNNVKSMFTEQASPVPGDAEYENPLCLLTKVIPLKGQMAKCEEALIAIASEIQKVKEWNEVRRMAKDPTKVHMLWSHMVLGIKHFERPRRFWKFKARLVGDGHMIINALGERVFPKCAHQAPASLSSLRCCCFYSLTQPDGICARGDAENAYLKSCLGDNEQTWIALEPALRPPQHRGYALPVMPLDRALYGHPEAGAAWGSVVVTKCTKLKWKRVVDIGEFSVWVRHMWDEEDKRYRAVLMVACTDDFVFGGRKKLVLI